MKQTAALIAAACLAISAPSAGDTPKEATLSTVVGDQTIELQVPASAVIVSFPRGDFAPAEDVRDGARHHPRYFHFVDATRGINVSGWIEPAKGFPGADRFWAGEMEALQRSGFPPSVPPAPLTAGDWNGMAYEVALPGATSDVVNSHLRAILIMDGTWIDLHVSVTTKAAAAEARAITLSMLQSISVKRK